MARTATPKYRKQKSRDGDRAFVELNGVRKYLGAYGSPTSYEEYNRAIAEWAANGRRLETAKDEVTIINLLARFWVHAQAYYVKPDGTHTSEVSNFRRVMSIMRKHYGGTLANEFGPNDERLSSSKQGWRSPSATRAFSPGHPAGCRRHKMPFLNRWPLRARSKM